MEPAPKGKRRPTQDDFEAIITGIANRQSLRDTCQKLGLDTPSTHRWIKDDENRRQRYAHARDLRCEAMSDHAVSIAFAAATGRTIPVLAEDGQTVERVAIDPKGARVYVDAIFKSIARLEPAQTQALKIDLTSRVRDMTDEEIVAELAAMGVGVRPVADEGESLEG